jgi:O-antigen/teichoic acid export membrane protein
VKWGEGVLKRGWYNISVTGAGLKISEKKRTKKVIIGSSALAGSTGISVLVGVVLAGLLARYFTSEEFGLWSMLTSLNGILLGGFDFGFGNALRNRMSQVYSCGDGDEGKIYFFSIFYFFIVVSTVLTLTFYLVMPLVPWQTVFKSTNAVIIKSGSSLMILGASILTFGIAFNVYTAGFFSYQEAHWNAIISGVSKLFLLLFTIWFVLSLRSFFAINVMGFLVTLLSSVSGFIAFLFVRKWRFVLVGLKTIVSSIRELWRKSAQFALLQLFSTFLLMADLFVVSKISGLGIVGEYFLVKRVYLVLASFHFAVLLPIWSAYTEAVESGDIKWVEKAVKRSARYTVMIFAAGMIGMCLEGKLLIQWWTGKEIGNLALLIWLGVWGFLYGWCNCFSVFLNATGNLKRQIILVGLGSLMFVPLSLFCGGKFGVVGICYSLILVSLPVAVSNPIETMSIINRFKRERE